MSVHTAPIAVGNGGLRFARVMAGEYYAEAPNGRYTIDYHETGCGDCDHSHRYWVLEFYTKPSRYRRYPVHTWKCRTLTDARIAAAEHMAEGAAQ